MIFFARWTPAIYWSLVSKPVSQDIQSICYCLHTGIFRLDTCDLVVAGVPISISSKYLYLYLTLKVLTVRKCPEPLPRAGNSTSNWAVQNALRPKGTLGPMWINCLSIHPLKTSVIWVTQHKVLNLFTWKNIPDCVRTNKNLSCHMFTIRYNWTAVTIASRKFHFKQPHNLNLWGIKSHIVFHPQSFSEPAIYLSIYMYIMPKMASTIQHSAWLLRICCVGICRVILDSSKNTLICLLAIHVSSHYLLWIPSIGCHKIFDINFDK